MNKDKEKIRGIVKESLAGLFEKSKKSKKAKKEKTKVDTEDEKTDDKKDDDEKASKVEKIEYNDVINFFKKHKTIKQVGVFREAGFSEEEIYQRLPYKKLNKETNEAGGTYSFDKDEVDRIRTILDKYPG